jgi:hypothetical protein
MGFLLKEKKMNVLGTHIDTGLLVVIVVVGSVLVSILTYYILRFLRGSIKLTLPRTSFNAGEAITGNFELQTKKDIEGNKLLVSLIGVRVTKSYHNGKSRTHTDEIYRDAVILEEARPYPAGYLANYSFTLKTPNWKEPEFLNSKMGQTLTTAFKLLGGSSSHIKWKIEARLDAKGVDLATSKAVSLNT